MESSVILGGREGRTYVEFSIGRAVDLVVGRQRSYQLHQPARLSEGDFKEIKLCANKINVSTW